MWRTVGFFMSFAVVIELCALVTSIIIILGGIQSRKFGWKIVCSLLVVAGIVQCVGMAIVVCNKCSILLLRSSLQGLRVIRSLAGSDHKLDISRGL